MVKSKKVISMVLVLSMLMSMLASAGGVAFAAETKGFADVGSTHWAYEYVNDVVARGLFNGTGDGTTFSPEDSMTRGMFVTVLSRMDGADVDNNTSTSFSDVQSGQWYTGAVAWAAKNGIVKGTGDGTAFSPDLVVNREQLAVMLVRYCEYAKLEHKAVNEPVEFTDASTISDWATEAVAFCQVTGLITGYKDGSFGATRNAQRAEVAAVASRFAAKVDEAKGEVPKGSFLVTFETNGGSNVDSQVVAAEEKAVRPINPTRRGYTFAGWYSDAKLNTAYDFASSVTAEVTIYAKWNKNTGGGSPALGSISIEPLGAVSLIAGATQNVTPAATASNGQMVSFSVVSSNTDVVSAAMTENVIALEAKTAGRAEITVAATAAQCAAGTAKFTVTVEPQNPSGDVVLYDGTSTAPVLMDEHYNTEDTISTRTHTQISRAVGDFRQDVAMVTGAIDYKVVQQLFEDNDQLQAQRLGAADPSKVPALIHAVPEGTTYQNAVIVGAIGESNIIDGIIADGKLDEAKDVKGIWEAYVIKAVANPIPGVENALVIAGSDARGAIYGLYTISEEIGVSPWYWYSDVAVDTKSEISVDYTTALLDDGPDVKYRGIFFNDEEHSTDWANVKFKDVDGKAPGVNYYRRAFEVILRLKANTLWPSMHECSQAFNLKVDENGVPVNGKEAGKYGIIMGSSHCEQMLRNNVGEWWDWKLQKDENGNYKNKQYFEEFGGTNPPGGFANDDKAYDYTINPRALLAYWKARVEASKDFESIYVLALRGMHDGEFYHRDLNKFPGGTDMEKKVNAIKEIINEQRKIFAEVYGMENVNKIPQALIPYREVGEFYNAGVKDMMLWDGKADYNNDGVTNELDDCGNITLMWAEDNENFLRQVATDEERARPGGSGVYYHNSYYARPREMSYLWINSTQMSTMSEEMHRAYDTGAQTYWILNVGDLKPGEVMMEFFLKMAWDVESWDDTTMEDYLAEHATRDYKLSQRDAETVAEAMDEFYQLIGIKKPEFYNSQNTEPGGGGGGFGQFKFSAVANGDESMLWLARCTEMADTLGEIYDKMPERYKTSFYQKIYYNALVVKETAEHYMYFRKNNLTAAQGRAGSSYIYASLSQDARQRILDRQAEFNGQNGGKWPKMMNINHAGNNYDIIGLEKYKVLNGTATGLGASCENQTTAGNGTLRFNSQSPADQRYFDVFSMGAKSEKWVAETNAEWITLSLTSGQTSTEQRVIVTVDWTKAAAGAQAGTISVYSAGENGGKTGEAVAIFDVRATKSTVEYGDNKGYIEANGYVAIEAEHFTQNIPGTDGYQSRWDVIQSNAQHGDTMKSWPDVDSYSEDWANTAKLVYKVYFDNAGIYKLTLNRLPTLNEGVRADGQPRTINVGVGVNENIPSVLKGSTSYKNSGNTVWQYNLQRMYEPLSVDITVNQGWNNIVIYRCDSAFIIDRMVIETEPGVLPYSWMGPAESPNNIVPAPAVVVGALPDALENYRVMDGIETVQGKAITVTCEGTESAAAGNPDVVSVDTVADGKITITGKRAGTTTVRATTQTGTSVIPVRVNPKVDAGEGVYLEKDGQVVIDAADVLNGKAGAIMKADAANTHSWYLSDSGIAVLPDDGNTDWADIENNAPSLTYQIYIATPGTYYEFLNMSNPDIKSDSYHVKIDGNPVYSAIPGNASGKKVWFSAGKGTALTEGEHTVTIYAREDGLLINQVVLTTNKSAKFSDFLPVSENEVQLPRVILQQPGDMELTERESAEEVTLTATVSPEAEITFSAVATDVTIATVTVTGNKLAVTPVAVGETTITVTASAEGCKSAVKRFTVQVASADPLAAELKAAVDAKLDEIAGYSYPLGDGLGCYSQASYDALLATLAAADEVATAGGVTEEVLTAQLKNITDAENAMYKSLNLTDDVSGTVYNAYRDFESDDVGGVMPYGFQPFDTGVKKGLTDGGAVAIVSEDGEDGPNQFLRLTTTGEKKSSANLLFSYAMDVTKAAAQGEKVIIECRARNRSDTCTYANICMPQNEKTPSAPAMTVAFDHDKRMDYKFVIKGGGNVAERPMDYAMDTWYTVKLVADMDAGTYTVIIDGEQRGGTYTFRNLTTALTGQVLGLDERPNGQVDFDDIKVSVAAVSIPTV